MNPRKPQQKWHDIVAQEKAKKERGKKLGLDPKKAKKTRVIYDGSDAQVDLSGSSYFRAKRYAADINRGLRVLENINKGVTVFGSRFGNETQPDYQHARLLGQLLARNGHTVVTGGGPGIMEAANRGAYEVGGTSVGLKIHLPRKDEEPNEYTNLGVTFQYFFARKVALVAASKCFVFFPGGFGTLDELTEVLVLQQEKKMTPAPIYLVDSAFWIKFDTFIKEALDRSGYINQGDLNLYKITDDIREIVSAMNDMPESLIKGDIA